MKKIESSHAPAAIGPYSQAIVYDHLLFTSGQIPLDPETGAVVGTDVQTQAQQVMKNLEAVLTSAGSGFDRVIKTVCYLADMGDFAAFNRVYGEYFTAQPARSCIAVKALPRNVLCEVELIAAIGEE